MQWSVHNRDANICQIEVNAAEFAKLVEDDSILSRAARKDPVNLDFEWLYPMQAHRGNTVLVTRRQYDALVHLPCRNPADFDLLDALNTFFGAQ